MQLQQRCFKQSL